MRARPVTLMFRGEGAQIKDCIGDLGFRQEACTALVPSQSTWVASIRHNFFVPLHILFTICTIFLFTLIDPSLCHPDRVPCQVWATVVLGWARAAGHIIR